MARSSYFRKRRFLSPLRKTGQYFSKAEKRKKLVLVITALASAALFFLATGSLVSMVLFAVYSKNLPSPNKLLTRDVELSTRIFDRNGELLYDIYGEKNRTVVRLEEISPYLVQATLATEDADFYKHQGFDPLSWLRATFNIARGRGLQGGSTITQQLVKNALLSSERTITRKIKEFVLALQIERRYSKNEILQMYLNEAPYGGQAWGVQAAAEMYFGKDAKDLTLGEAALLAGLPQRPSVYSPFGAHPEKAAERQSYVLYLMSERGWLGEQGQREYLPQALAEQARGIELEYAGFGHGIKAPHFVMYVRELLTERYGTVLVERGGLQVTTSLDWEMQEKAQEIVTDEVEKAADLWVGNGGLVAMDPKTGQILAMVGSKDYFAEDYDGKYNVTIAERQPGSSIKPITYATAFKQGYTPATLLMDVKTTFPGGEGLPDYIPENYDGKFRGPMQLRYALGSSINVAAVKLLKLVGIPAMLQTAHDMGITTLNEPERYGLALTLGGGEVKLLDMATAFSTLASGGVRRDPVAILKVTDYEGKVLEEYRDNPGRRVLSEEQAYLVSHILADDTARYAVFGAHSLLYIPGREVAVKTGTTDDKKDNWCIGYTPSLAVAAWVGNNDNSEMHPRLASGVTGATPIWRRAMLEFLADTPQENFHRPSGIVSLEVDKLSGQLPIAGRETRWEIFAKGTEPTQEDQVHQLLKICTVDGKLASEACEKDAWVEETYKDDPTYRPPTEKSVLYLDEHGHLVEYGSPLVGIKTPADATTVPLEFEVEAEVRWNSKLKPKWPAPTRLPRWSFISMVFFWEIPPQSPTSGSIDWTRGWPGVG